MDNEYREILGELIEAAIELAFDEERGQDVVSWVMLKAAAKEVGLIDY